MKTDKFIDLSV